MDYVKPAAMIPEECSATFPIILNAKTSSCIYMYLQTDKVPSNRDTRMKFPQSLGNVDVSVGRYPCQNGDK